MWGKVKWGKSTWDNGHGDQTLGRSFGGMEVRRVNMERVDVGVLGARTLRLQEGSCDLLVPRLPRRDF